jgi:CHAD domain-containing protein
MAYRMELHEGLPRAVRRIGRDLFDDAIENLKVPAAKRAVGVHEARKDFKKLRALLALVAAAFDPDTLDMEDTTIRDAGRSLAAARDADVMVGALDALRKRFGGVLEGTAFVSIRRALMRERRAGVKRLIASDVQLREVVSSLERARDRIDAWPLSQDDFNAIRLGLRRAYARGRSSRKRVRHLPTSDNVHTWRKAVKELWYHTRLLEPIWPPMMEPLASELEVLAGALGEDHDLALLRQTVLDRAARDSRLDDAGALVALLDQRRAELQVTALGLGERLYAETPVAFIARMKKYWIAARRGQPTDPEELADWRAKSTAVDAVR